MLIAGAIVALFFIGLCQSGRSADSKVQTDAPKTTEPQKPKFEDRGFGGELSADQLYEAFKNNEVRAENEYKHKRVILNGKAHAISSDSHGIASITLLGRDVFHRIDAELRESERADAAALSKGQTISLGCWVDYNGVFAVYLKDCTILRH